MADPGPPLVPPPPPPPEAYASEDTESDDEGAAAREEWAATWRGLSEEVAALEAECREQALRPRSMNQAQFGELTAEQAEIDREGQRQCEDALWGGLRHLRKRVLALAQNTHQGAPVAQLQAVTRGIEREFDSFKAQQRQQFEAAAGMEPGLEDSLLVWGKRYEAWAMEPSALPVAPAAPETGRGSGGGGSSGSRSPSPKSPCDGNAAGTGAQTDRGDGQQASGEDPEIRDIRAALAAFEAEDMQPGAATGGWSSVRHEVFLRIFRSFGGKPSPAFYARAAEWLRGTPEVDFVDHVRWLADHEARQVKKRRLLARWRERRAELEREAAGAREELYAEQLTRRRQAEGQRRQARTDVRREVAEWRRSVAEGEAHAGARQRRLAEEQTRRERSRLRRQQESAERELKVFWASKEREAERQQRAQVGAGGRRSLSQEDRQRLAQRNMDLLDRRLQVAQAAVQAKPPLPQAQDLDPAAKHHGRRRPPAAGGGDLDELARMCAANARSASAGPGHRLWPGERLLPCTR